MDKVEKKKLLPGENFALQVAFFSRRVTCFAGSLCNLTVRSKTITSSRVHHQKPPMFLFGSKPAQQQPPSSGLGFSFGSNSAPQTAPQTQASTFSTNIQNGQNAQNSQTNTNTSAFLGLGKSNFSGISSSSTLPSEIAPDASSTKILKDLLDSANNLPKLDNANLGSIHMPLNELQNKLQMFKKKDNVSGNYTQAHYLLSGSGINAADIESELKHLSSSGADITRTHALDNTSVSSAPADRPESIENYLIAKKEENILNAIEQSLASASKDFDQFINQNVVIDWKVRKEHLKKSLGIPIKNKITNEELAKSFAWNKSLPGNYRILTPLVAKGATSSTRQLSRDKFESHAKVIYNLNEARLQDKNFPLCLCFEELNKSNADLKSKQMGEVWRILADLCNERFVKVNQEQLFFDEYSGAKIGNKLKKRIVLTSRAYLEGQFFAYMDEIYTKDDKKPDVYLPANNINKVLFFIHKVITKNNNEEYMKRTLNINGVPIWALLFYLMRSGLYAEAIELTTVNRDAFDKFDSNFPVYLNAFVKADGFGLPSQLQARISSDFSQTFQFLNEDSTNLDPYKYAVYKIVGKCDLAKKSLPNAINLSIEDWLWYHLLLINEFNPEASSSLIYENYTLENLQKKVVSLGPNKFNASSNNPLYAKSLIMLGLYETAVQYVYEFSNECDAVHLATGLCYYGLLRVSSTKTDDLVSITAEDIYEINFSRLLGSYTRTFKISDPKVAAQYLILICMSKGGHSPGETAKCHEALRELILLSREFGLLLGELNSENGDSSSGILKTQRSLINLPELQNFYHQIIEVSASRCEEEGRIFDALRLYQLCQEYNTVVSLLNKFLSEVISMNELDKPLLTGAEFKTSTGALKPEETVDNNIILLSKSIMTTFNNNSYIIEKVSSKQREINGYLLPIVDIRQKFIEKDWQGTLSAVKDLGLIPIVSSDDFVDIRHSAEALANYDVCLLRVIPSLLIIVMTCIAQMNYSILTKRYGAADHERFEVHNLKQIAKNCMVYAGMIQYKMPRETYSLLINLEAQL